MEVEFVETLAKLRLVIGFLGERDQFGWWQSSFFTKGSDAFLSPLFGRTQILAQCNGVTQAALIIHDERIGVGNVYHLFRLPEDIEQNIHNILHDLKPQGIVADKETAIDYLEKNSIKPMQESLGPARGGDTRSLHDPNTWQIVSGLYLFALKNGINIYPYYSNIQ